MIPIHSEATKNDEPPWLLQTLQRLLASLPEEHCGGLGAIVLTRSEIALSRKRTRTARAQRRGGALGIYHRAFRLVFRILAGLVKTIAAR